MSDDAPRDDKPALGEADREIPEEVDVAEAGGDGEAPEQYDDEAEDSNDAGEDEGETRQVAEPPRRGRAAERIERQQSENRELRSRYADLERQLAELRQQQRQPTAAEIAEAERREAEAVQMMAPHEVARYYAQKSEQTTRAELNQTRQMLWDQNDSTQFETLLSQNPNYRRYTERVEDLRKQAPGVSRRILLATAIGMRAMEGAPAAKTRAQNRGAASAERHQVRPSNGRGDVAGPSERGGGAGRWDRLRNVQI